MSWLRRWFTARWQLLADFLEGLGDIGDFGDDVSD